MAETSNNAIFKMEDGKKQLKLTAGNLSDLFKLADRTGFGVGVHERGKEELLSSEQIAGLPGEPSLVPFFTNRPEIGGLLQQPSPRVAPTELTEQEQFDEKIAEGNKFIEMIGFQMSSNMIDTKAGELAIKNMSESMKGTPTPMQRERARVDIAGVKATTEFRTRQAGLLKTKKEEIEAAKVSEVSSEIDKLWQTGEFSDQERADAKEAGGKKIDLPEGTPVFKGGEEWVIKFGFLVRKK